MPRLVLPTTALLSTVLAVGATLIAPSVASAATTVSQSGITLSIVGDDAPSALRHDGFYNGFQVEDTTGAAVNAGPGCVPINQSAVACGAFGGGDTYGKNYVISAKLGGGDDDFKYAIFDGPQTIEGEDGNDSIEASAGKDTVRGGPGNDSLSGQIGDDTLDGGPGNDSVAGSEGNDVVIGGPGVDSLLGDSTVFYQDGNDTILARDGEGDQVACGGGADRAEVDAGDVTNGCEAVDAPITATPGPAPGPGPNPQPTPTPTPAPPAKLSLTATVTTKQTPSGLASGKQITVTLAANRACQGKIALAVTKGEAKRLKLGTKALTLGTSKLTAFAASAPTKVTVGIDSKYRSKLKKASKVKVSVVVACAASPTDASTGALDFTAKK